MKQVVLEQARKYAGSTVFRRSRMVSVEFCGKECGKRGKHGFPPFASRGHAGRKRAGSPNPPFRGDRVPPQAASGFWK
jgi:hypothetical protein